MCTVYLRKGLIKVVLVLACDAGGGRPEVNGVGDDLGVEDAAGEGNTDQEGRDYNYIRVPGRNASPPTGTIQEDIVASAITISWLSECCI